jgi:hypothetical protein
MSGNRESDSKEREFLVPSVVHYRGLLLYFYGLHIVVHFLIGVQFYFHLILEVRTKIKKNLHLVPLGNLSKDRAVKFPPPTWQRAQERKCMAELNG